MTLTRNRLALIVSAVILAAVVPFLLPTFLLVQIVIKTLWLGTIAATLTFLARYGGMVSLAQASIYGAAGYVTAYLTVRRGLNPWIAAALAILVAVLIALIIGLLSARSRDIYFLMLTLACAVFLFYFAAQASVLGGHGGINGTTPPSAWGLSFRDPIVFYYLALLVAVVGVLLLRLYARSSLGLALQGARDCPERMESIGFNGSLVRVLGFTMAGFVAALGGVVALWYNGQIAPGSIDVVRSIDVLVAAVIGGMELIEGAWLGALIITLLANYANNITNRAETVIGLVFIAVVLFSPGGLVGLFKRLLHLRFSGRGNVRTRKPAGSLLATDAHMEE